MSKSSHDNRSDRANRRLCMSLLKAESQVEVVSILQDHSYWDSNDVWQKFGARENNYSVIGAQQADPAAALVEKLVNSVDAVLMRESYQRKIDPRSSAAPKSMADALETFFEIKEGNLAKVDTATRTSLAENIAFMATGKKSLPNYIIFDRGEGQNPSDIPRTFLSITESVKQKIPFVQGKFHMGGTGVLRFCRDRSLQLIISRRHPEIDDSNGDQYGRWGFTVVRREDPSEGRKSSMFTYLAPAGKILSFDGAEISTPLATRGTQKIAPLNWGTIIKLYEYEIPGFRTNILFDLYNRISLLLPRVGLPVRFYERRDYRGRSLETTMAGLHVRLEEDKRENLEDGFPTSAEFTAMGQLFTAQIYAFKRKSSAKYKKQEGILFISNGQTQGTFSKSFFTRKSAKMSYIADSILVIVDYGQLDPGHQEILVMNSRDRLSKSEFRAAVEKQLEEIVATHQGLRELRERRKREATEAMLADMKPLQEALEEVLRKSPSLQQFFAKGFDISNPFKPRVVGENGRFEGNKYPTFFRIVKGHEDRTCHKKHRFRVQFDTDAANDYFTRDYFPGEFRFALDGHEVKDFVLNLWNGVVTLTVSTPDHASVGDRLHGSVWVSDETQIQPFTNDFYRNVLAPTEFSGGGNGRRDPPGKGEGDRQIPAGFSLPDVHEVHEEDWPIHNFDKYSALRVVDDGDGDYQFFANVDNIFLKSEIKAAPRNADPRLIEARYTYALVLLGLALLKDKEILLKDGQDEVEDSLTIEEIILQVSRAISPILLPMIEALGGMEMTDLDQQFDIEQEAV